jgi:hypothetical protein
MKTSLMEATRCHDLAFFTQPRLLAEVGFNSGPPDLMYAGAARWSCNRVMSRANVGDYPPVSQKCISIILISTRILHKL